MRPKILVVEDSESFRQHVCTILERRGVYELIECADGLEAVGKAEELQPDLILLDIHLPSLNGIEAARRIRGLANSASILFLSQERSADFVHAALGLGARGYIDKVKVNGDLLRAVDTVLQGGDFVSEGLLSDASRLWLNLRAPLSEVVARAVKMTSADKGNLQILDRKKNELHIVAHHGFSARFLEFFDYVQHSQGSCGTALARGQRVIVDDIANDSIFRGTKSGEVVLAEGIRAVQSIPLRTEANQLVGVLSVHFRVARPSRENLFALTDAFAQQVADLIHSKLWPGV